MQEHDWERLERRLGICRRELMNFIWLHGQECTGYTETMLRSESI